MKMIAQNAEKVQMADTISHFMKRFRVGNLLKACNAYKEKGVKPLTNEDRKDVFIVDDTLHQRQGYKKTELCAVVFDHVDMKSRKGFRLLTLGWSDGNTLIPIGQRLLSSTNDDKVLSPQKQVDRRTLAGRRRLQARRKATEVMVELLTSALKAGIKAKYVLFDSWFASRSGFCASKRWAWTPSGW